MKKKLIIIVTFLFFLSTTGLPISMHYCETLKITSLSKCEVCTLEENEKESSCCEDKDDYPLKLKSENSDQCCDTKIIDKSISDNFIPLKLELKQGPSSTVIYLTDLISKQLRLDHQIINRTASPPSAYLTDLYLQNSVFLI